MSEAVTPKPRVGRTAQGRRQLRSALAVAALDLFASRGFDATTVDQIADSAGVARRTFFRYFQSKEDVLFPDHAERLAEVERVLSVGAAEESPLVAVSRAAESVLEMYLGEPAVSLRRFEVTRQVPSLRDKEIVTIDRYQRVFARYLQRQYSELAGDALRASVAASAVVAAHNHVLREWLKSGGETNARASLREALRLVREALSASCGDVTAPADQVVVSVVRTGASAGEVMEHLEGALRDL